MREIDPIRKPSEALLSGALRRLATGSPQKAPAEVGDSLMEAFRSHHRRRRRVRAMGLLGVAVSIAVAVALLLGRGPSASKQARQIVPSQPAEQRVAPAPGTQKAATQQAAATSRPAGRRSSQSSSDDFLPLPSYDPAITPEDLRIVRLELPGAALRLLGAPVSEDVSEKRMLADFVVGQDGTPYAVRLVQ
jgi:hypothetical protein